MPYLRHLLGMLEASLLINLLSRMLRLDVAPPCPNACPQSDASSEESDVDPKAQCPICLNSSPVQGVLVESSAVAAGVSPPWISEPVSNQIRCNVLELTPAMIPGHVDLMWAGPPCMHYSLARTTAGTPRDVAGSDAPVQHTLDLAGQLLCPFFIENPRSGLLKTRDVLAHVPFRVVDYCKYADDSFAHKARKRTTIWTNTTWQPSRHLCQKDCGYCVGGRHVDSAQRGPSRGATGRHTLLELYAIPPALVKDIAGWADG